MIAELRTDTELERLVACDWLCEYGTEADWNRLLDQHSGDQAVRHRFGLWLLEQGQAKGEGYLALSACELDCADLSNWDNLFALECPYWTHTKALYWPAEKTRRLPIDWFEVTQVKGSTNVVAPAWLSRTDATREELDEAAAVAFLLLPLHRREQLLKGEM